MSVNEMNKPELIGNIIDIFEDFLDEKGIIVPNPERDEDPELDAESSANIYGEDYDSLSTSLENLLRSWNITEPSEPVSNLEVLLWWYYMCRILYSLRKYQSRTKLYAGTIKRMILFFHIFELPHPTDVGWGFLLYLR